MPAPIRPELGPRMVFQLYNSPRRSRGKSLVLDNWHHYKANERPPTIREQLEWTLVGSQGPANRGGGA